MKISFEDRGRAIPKFYGVAYKEYNRAVVVYLPIPINIIVGYAVKIRYWFKTSMYTVSDNHMICIKCLNETLKRDRNY